MVEQQVVSSSTWFKDELGLAKADFAAVVLKKPSVLGLDVPRQLRPKAAYLRRMLSGCDLKELVLASPDLLCLSLIDTIVPRLQFCQAKGHWPLRDLEDVRRVLSGRRDEFLSLLNAEQKQ